MEKIYKIGETGIKILACVPLVLLSVIVVLFQNSITMDILEKSTINEHSWKFYLLLVVALIALFIFYKVSKYIPESVLFIILALAYIVGGIYLITHIQMVLRYDSGICYWNALNYIEGNFTNLQVGEYFYKNPHQLGLVLYNTILIFFNDNENFVYYINLIWIVLGNFFLWRTSVLVNEDEPAIRKMIITFSFLFLPQFFYLFFAYGQVPGLGCLMIALYCVVHTIQKNSRVPMFVAFVFIGIACLVRMNYAIAGIALVIICLLYTFKNKRIFLGISTVCIVLCILLPRMAVNGYYEKVANTDLSNGMPSTLYVAMGLQESDELWRANGWYNSYNDTIYADCNADAELANEIAVEEIKSRLQIFADDPGYAISFFREKLITTWCEPTYQAIWSGPLICMNCATEVEWISELYSGGPLFVRFSQVMNIINIFIFVFSAVYVLWNLLWDKKEINVVVLFGILYCMGGFLFHVVWETKSQYVYPYVVCLIPVAAQGIHMICSKITFKKKLEKEVNN